MKKGLLVVLILLFASGSQASLVLTDLPVFGVSAGALDTDTGLIWLNLQFTQGLSYSQVATGSQFNDFRYATRDEWSNLYTKIGFDTNANFYIPNPSQELRSTMDRAVSLLGDVTQTGDPNDKNQGGLLANSQGTDSHLYVYWSLDNCLNERNCGTPEQISTYGQYFTLSPPSSASYIPDSQAPYGGSYLVKVAPVPVPATILLLGSGLIGLMGFRRKFKT